MVNIFKSHIRHSVVACITIIAFTTTLLTPPPLIAANLNLATINFGIKIEKLYEKVKKSISKGETNKIVGYMFDFKREVEQYTGKTININKQIDEVQKKAKANGHKIDDKYLNQIKKNLHKEDKRHRHRAV